jgi:hypothetical protein
MSTTHLEQIFKANLWHTGINPKIKTAIESNFRCQSWFSSRSRTLQQVLNNTFGNYYNSTTTFKILYGMCALLKNNMQFAIYPEYATITSTMSLDLEENLTSYLNFPRVDSQKFNIVLYHIPKGKSYLKPALDNLEGPKRLKQIETYCILNSQHFIRIFENFNSSGANTITVFSDYFNNDLIYTLWTMLPHLMRITIHESDTELTEEQVLHNTRATILYEFFNSIYKIFQNSNPDELTVDEINAFKQEIFQISTKYAEQFDFVSEALGSFTTQLSKIKNEIANSYYTRELNSAMSNITRYEQNLESEYNRKNKLERLLISIKQTSDEDIKPLINCITNSKAIEILNTTNKEMILRITAPLQYFQETDFEAYEKNPNSMYNEYFRREPILQKVFHKIFVTREYQLMLQAIIHLQIQDAFNENPLKFYAERYCNRPNLTQFPNPHLYHHDCWGRAKSEMNKNIYEGNYELVVMQMIAAVQSVNVAENASFVSGLLGDIKNSSTLRDLLTFIIKTPEGAKELNYQQILDYERNLEQQTILQHAEETIAQNPQTYTQVELPDDGQLWV